MQIADEKPPVRSAYIHVPFCRHRCGYCNFTVIANRDDLINDYLRAIEIELSGIKRQWVDTLFFGGGTPTHLANDQLEKLFQIVLDTFPVSPRGEISIEANPEDICPEIVSTCARFSVNRISLGVQSFRDDKLEKLERGHSQDIVARCLEALRPSIESVSLDLIFGSPGETITQWSSDLDAAIELMPDHISTYGLTYEAGTQFYVRKEKQELIQLPEEAEREMYELAIDRLESAGFEHYEVSNFAKPHHRCRHNENYWNCGSFYGIGPGASGYVDHVRRSNHRSTTTYLKKVLANESPIAESDSLSTTDRAHERLVFGLRRLEGVRRDEFQSATGMDVMELVGDNLKWLAGEGLLLIDDERVRLTRKGLMVSDSIWPYLL